VIHHLQMIGEAASGISPVLGAISRHTEGEDHRAAQYPGAPLLCHRCKGDLGRGRTGYPAVA
jgi:hypothetical protein